MLEPRDLGRSRTLGALSTKVFDGYIKLMDSLRKFHRRGKSLRRGTRDKSARTGLINDKLSDLNEA
jgi:hypothetical protein